MVMKTVLEALDGIPDALREHYVENTNPQGKKEYVLAIEGTIDPLPGVKALRSEAGTYRTKLTELEKKYGTIAAFEGMNHAEIMAKIDRIAELEAAAGGKIDDKKIDEIVNSRIKTHTGPLERNLQSITAERDNLLNENKAFKESNRQRAIDDNVRQVATELKLLPTAVEDAMLYARGVMEVNEQGVVTMKDTGLDVKTWLQDMQAKRPHWWGPSAGGGGAGNGGTGLDGGSNPWSADGWNMTQQGQIVRADPAKAERLAKQAGTTVGGRKPQPVKK